VLSDADRESLLSALSRHAAEDRITLEELERRVEAVMAATTIEEARAVLADLPPLQDAGPPTPPSPRPAWGRGHGDADRAEAHWQPTSERFRDPKSGRVMRVWVDGGGGRHYVAE
jgi:hypothetical protein